ncbi:peptide/nickel transport system substrate-binding protein [Tistlia consotensis]|uniref:Peptide/nickel transport system substrate-binding protein n=1 Tax=Tistlia consotensis USBA 355 TaxID=560819 RepID=A0A1Y6BQF6_9PROT|nr:ABC transporter substrate-binding protein [Tistlia consotensis]SMF23688.1 peptide/nickel transport system substrate-binding protein [Tistlia consotensis USBA 355]SNR61364.1 peptide/nickel transport system substrate-binding protein [Tistlia consotensis]
MPALRHLAPALLLGLLAALASGPAGAAGEPPALAARVAAGDLPPLAGRLPAEPRRDLPKRSDWQPGRYGGSLTMLVRGGRDARSLSVFGYSRLVVWNEALELVPDLLLAFKVEEGRRFTLTLRRGHRWSDGAPFTSDDFRFWWREVASNPLLSPAGLPAELLVEGQPPSVTFPDERTVVYEWARPNARFLPTLAGTAPLTLFRPAHYLKRFHPDFTDPAALDAEARAAGLPGWAALFEARDAEGLLTNPERPTLDPWIVTTAPPTDRWHAVRNPFFHRVDGQGRQLPYLDAVDLVVASQALIAGKTATGESDLQAVGLALPDYPLLQSSAARAGIELRLWPIGRGAQLALYPNLNAADPVWRRLLRQADFRRALSLGIDRQQISTVVFKGLAIGGNDSLLPGSPLYRPMLRNAYANHDPARANALLDGLGLTARTADGWRALPDGRPLTLVIETGRVDPSETDVLELVQSDLKALGIQVLVADRGRSNLRARVASGETVMSLFYGLANGLATAESDPAELAPTDGKQNQWPLWGLWTATGGRSGERPEDAKVLRLLQLYRDWSEAASPDARRLAWEAMLAIRAEELFTIGLVAGVPQPVAVRRGLRNVPGTAPYLYEPGAYFGRYRPDTFWFEADKIRK